MRTAHFLPISAGMHCSQWGDVPGPGGGVYLIRGVYLVQGVYLVREGVPGPRGCIWSQGGLPGPGGCTWFQGDVPAQVLPPVDRITDACENITLPQLRCGR